MKKAMKSAKSGLVDSYYSSEVENNKNFSTRFTRSKNNSLDNEEYIGILRIQHCPVCEKEMGDMPGMCDAVCHNCGFKDPCCE